MTTKTTQSKPTLNPRQREFAKLYVATGNASEAYRQAGYATADADVSASRLLVHAGIQAEIQRLRAITVKSGVEVRSIVMNGLLDLAESAEPDSSRIRAMELLGKTERMFVEVSETTVVHESAALEQYTESQLAAMLEVARSQPSSGEPEPVVTTARMIESGDGVRS